MLHEVQSHLASEGFHVSINELVADGKLHRFAQDKKDVKKSCWYVLFQNYTRKSGEQFYVIRYGNWRDGTDRTYCTLSENLSADDKRAIKTQMEEARKRQAAHKRQLQEQVAQEVRVKWNALETAGSHEYLDRKQIGSCPMLGVRFGLGKIYVPMRDVDGSLWSLQTIWIGEDGKTFKNFRSGGRVEECFHTIGDLESSEAIVLCEGLATAASVHMATGYAVANAFTSGNLPKVAAALKRKYPSKAFIVAADNDLWTVVNDVPKNPGREKGEEAAQKCMGRLVLPEFKNVDSKPTDFNDLHVIEGLGAVRDQIMERELPKVARYFPLGVKGRTYFFTSTKNPQIFGITAFTKKDFLDLMDLGYWEIQFPSSGRENAGVNWTAAQDHVMRECLAKGMFQDKKVRGTGVWLDAGRVVVNLGDHLNVGGRRYGLRDFKSEYFYSMGYSIQPIHERPLGVDECETLIKACSGFKWKSPDFGYLLGGALVLARVCGALPIRPNIWITAEKGAGKSTIYRDLCQPILGDLVRRVTGNTTEAFIRQTMDNSAVPLLFDEFETESQKSAERIQDILGLMRASWDNAEAGIGKGGADGSPILFYPRFSSFVFSINTNLLGRADQSRFAVLSFTSHAEDSQEWKNLKGWLSEITPEFGERLFARTIRMLPTLLENFKRLKRAFSGKTTSRFSDQYGMLLAGYSILLQDDAITDAQAGMMVDWIKLEEEKAEAAISDHDDCLTQLLTKKVTLEIDGDRRDMVISEAIHAARTRERGVCEALQRIGIKVDCDSVAIASNHTELESLVYRGTRWSKAWSSSLARLPGAQKNKSVWIAQRNQKAVKIPWAVFSS